MSREEIDRPGGGFPSTRLSAVLGTRSEDPELRARAYETLIGSYWRPVYKYVRVRWKVSPEDAQDLTQAFFTRAMEKEFFPRYDPARARFRTYLRTCLDAFLANEQRAARRLKRAPDGKLLPLDFETAGGELRQREIADGTDMEEFFHQEWVRSLFAQAVETLRQRSAASDKATQFALFERYDLEGPDSNNRPTYHDLAREFALPLTQVTNYLAWARREFRGIVLAKLRAATASEEEFRAEARYILGTDPP
jgi:RNA polymerase sigma factor (sigma-70 family)